MNTVNRLMTNICSNNLKESKNFYITLLNFAVNYDSDWFVHLVSKGRSLELGIVDKTHDIVPKHFQNNPQGVYLTFVVDKADDIYETAQAQGFKIVSKPTDTFYGQRRLLLEDPDGTLIDVSSPIAN